MSSLGAARHCVTPVVRHSRLRALMRALVRTLVGWYTRRYTRRLGTLVGAHPCLEVYLGVCSKGKWTAELRGRASGSLLSFSCLHHS